MRFGKSDFAIAIMPISADKNFREKCRLLKDYFGDRVILPNSLVDGSLCNFDIASSVKAFNQSSLVFADLSFARPSCYFELGIAQALGCECMIVAEEETELHQHAGEVTLYRGITGLNRVLEATICLEN